MPDPGYDKWMDAQLRNVPLPPDLLIRLAKSTGNEDDLNARMDAVINDVPVPPGLEDRLRRIARRRTGVPLWQQVAMAASIFLALGLGAFGYLKWVSDQIGPLPTMVAATTETPAPAVTPTPAPVAPVAQTAVAQTPVAQTPVAQSAGPRAVATVPISTAGPTAPLAERAIDRRPSAEAVPLPNWELVSQAVTSAQQTLAARLREQAALGARGSFDQLPDLEVLNVPTSLGVAPPRVRGYDLMFQLKHGDHPFVSPAAHRDLLFSRMPFTFRTASYDLALRGMTTGQIPPAEEIRVEEFLAGMHYPLPEAPQTGLTLHTAGSVSPFGEKGLHLLQIAVQAADVSAANRAPVRMIVVLDASARMRFAARYEAVERALEKFARHMTSDDRVTLIGFSERPEQVVSNGTGGQLRSLIASAKLPRPHGSPDLAAAVEAGCQTATTGAAPEDTRVVFITAGGGDLDETSATKANQAAAQLAAAKIPCHIIRFGSPEPDKNLTALAATGGGEVTTANSADHVFKALNETLLGNTTKVAGGAALKLSFNPEMVTSYRLLGHESPTLTGGGADPIDIDLSQGQTATGLYELYIKPTGDVDVATAELTWTDPVSGELQRIRRPLMRADFAATLAEAPVWHQRGILAGKAGEAFRGSYYAPSTQAFSRLLKLAKQIDQRSDDAELQRLLQLVQQADKVR